MAKSNAAGIAVPQQAVADLEKLLDHLDRLPEIIGRSKSLSYGVTVFQVLHPLSQAASIDYNTMYDIFTALENLRFLEVEFGSADEALARIEAAIKPDVAQRLSEKRAGILEALAAYTQDNPILISFKAQRLAYLYEKVYRDADLLTEARPVFDSAGEKILEFIVSHSLVITYTAAGRSERLHLALDAGDVLKLRKACDRAILKAQTLKESLGRDADWKIHMLRDDNNGAE